jgi:hypothetical protein
MNNWWNEQLMKWTGCAYEMNSWWNEQLMKWAVDEMNSWWNEQLMKCNKQMAKQIIDKTNKLQNKQWIKQMGNFKTVDLMNSRWNRQAPSIFIYFKILFHVFVGTWLWKKRVSHFLKKIVTMSPIWSWLSHYFLGWSTSSSFIRSFVQLKGQPSWKKVMCLTHT